MHVPLSRVPFINRMLPALSCFILSKGGWGGGEGGVLGGLSVADRRLITLLMKTLPEGGVRAAASDVAPLLALSGILSLECTDQSIFLIL